MKRHFGKYALVITVGLAVAMLAACTSTSYPTSTPDTGVPPAQNPPPTPTPAPPPLGQAVTVNISAQNFAFDKSDITVPAGADVTLIFDNKEGIPHNVAVYTTPAATDVIFRGDVITGPKTITYQFKAPTTPGTYFFRCDVHPVAMRGTFTVTGP